MFDALAEEIAALEDSRAGWVTRRDAAEKLGEAAVRAASALNAHRGESDRDVYEAVTGALQRVQQAVSGQAIAPLSYRAWMDAAGGGEEPEGVAVEPGERPRSYTLEELVQGCAKPGVRDVAPRKAGYKITVTLRNGRQQRVYLSPFTRRDGAELVRVFTRCGKPDGDALAWALRANMKITQGALALVQEDGEDMLVLTNCFLLSETSPREVKMSVNEVAFYGDWVESKLSGLDDF